MSDYIIQENNDVIKTEAYYCNTYGQVRGHLLLTGPFI